MYCVALAEYLGQSQYRCHATKEYLESAYPWLAGSVTKQSSQPGLKHPVRQVLMQG